MPNLLYDLPVDIQERIFGYVNKSRFDEVIKQFSTLNKTIFERGIYDFIEKAKIIDAYRKKSDRAKLYLDGIIKCTSFQTWENYNSWVLIHNYKNLCLEYRERHMCNFTYKHTFKLYPSSRNQCLIEYFPKNSTYTIGRRWHEPLHGWFKDKQGLDFRAFRLGFCKPQAYLKEDLLLFCYYNGIEAYKSWTHKKIWNLVFKFNFPNFVQDV